MDGLQQKSCPYLFGDFWRGLDTAFVNLCRRFEEMFSLMDADASDDISWEVAHS